MFTLPNTRVFNSFEELCIMRVAAVHSFGRELNLKIFRHGFPFSSFFVFLSFFSFVSLMYSFFLLHVFIFLSFCFFFHLFYFSLSNLSSFLSYFYFVLFNMFTFNVKFKRTFSPMYSSVSLVYIYLFLFRSYTKVKSSWTFFTNF